MPVLDVRSRVVLERPCVWAVVVPKRSAPARVVGAIEHQPRIGAGGAAEAGRLLGEPRDPEEGGGVADGGADAAARE